MFPNMSKSSWPAADRCLGKHRSSGGDIDRLLVRQSFSAMHKSGGPLVRCSMPGAPIPMPNEPRDLEAAICPAGGGEGTSFSPKAVYPFVGLHDQMFEI